MPTLVVKLKPIVTFREFPFGTMNDPSMREVMAAEPWPRQDRVLEYLRSGHILGYPMSADLPDWLDPANKANPAMEGQCLGGVTPRTDGVWFWPAALIHFLETYHVAVPREFVDHAARHNWRVAKDRVRQGSYEYDY